MVPEVARWDKGLSQQAEVMVERRRRRYVKGYEYLKDQGFAVVAEVTPSSGRLLTRGRRAIVTMVQEMVAQEEIQRLHTEYTLLRKDVDYEWAEGSVTPVRRSAGDISHTRHIRAHTKGVTIFVREKSQAVQAEEVGIESMIAMLR